MKRQDALRKVRTICERLDAIDPHTFPIQPLTLYLFGSTLTDNANPADVDLVLVYRDNPEISYSAGEITHMLAYEPRLLSHNRASIALRRGMKRVQLHMSPNSIEFWEYLPLFPQGNGIRVIWKPDWHWQNLIDAIEATAARVRGRHLRQKSYLRARFTVATTRASAVGLTPLLACPIVYNVLVD